jgi:hypothetical protein
MRVVSLDRPDKGHQPLKVFNFTLEYCKRLQSSELLHAELNITSCLFGTVCIESCPPIGWRTLFDEKIRNSSFYFGLDCGMMEFFTYEPQSKEQLISPAFLEHGLAKKIAV